MDKMHLIANFNVLFAEAYTKAIVIVTIIDN